MSFGRSRREMDTLHRGIDYTLAEERSREVRDCNALRPFNLVLSSQDRRSKERERERECVCVCKHEREPEGVARYVIPSWSGYRREDRTRVVSRNAKIEWRKVVAIKAAAANGGPLTAIGEATSTLRSSPVLPAAASLSRGDSAEGDRGRRFLVYKAAAPGSAGVSHANKRCTIDATLNFPSGCGRSAGFRRKRRDGADAH